MTPWMKILERLGPSIWREALGELLADELGKDLSADVRELWEAFLATKRCL